MEIDGIVDVSIWEFGQSWTRFMWIVVLGLVCVLIVLMHEEKQYSLGPDWPCCDFECATFDCTVFKRWLYQIKFFTDSWLLIYRLSNSSVFLNNSQSTSDGPQTCCVILEYHVLMDCGG